ncbi:MAG TPA: hypothetical protein EYN40_01905 [Planctomycetes bacterium]|nr:hypothetical protein [Planctomycetota bacterium]
MAISDRPGGLTSLAFLNGFFAFTSVGPALWRIITSYSLRSFLQDPEHTRGRGLRKEMQSLVEAQVDPAHLQWLGVLGVVVVLLLLISVVGLWKQSRWAGKWCSTLAAVGMVSVSLLALKILPDDILRGVGMDLVRQLFYPLFLLFMVQVIFRKDLGKR